MNEPLSRMLAAGEQALFADGDLRVGREYFEIGFRAAEEAGDAEAMATAVLGLGGLWLHEHRTSSASALLQERLRRSLSLVDSQGSSALRLRARIAGEYDYRRGSHTAVLAVVDEARFATDPVAMTEALSFAHQCLMAPEHTALREQLAAELVAQSFSTGRPSDLLLGLLWQTVNQFLRGDPRAERRLKELREELADRKHLAMGFAADAVDVMRAIRTGRLGAAEELAARCEESGTRAGDIDAAAWHSSHLVIIRWYQGRLPELLPVLRQLAHSPELSEVNDFYTAVLALAGATAGDKHLATSVLAGLCKHALADLPRSNTWMVTLYAIVETAFLVGDAEVSQLCYELLAPFAALPVIGGLGVVCLGSAHHALGVACLTSGALDKAVQHFEEAVRQNLSLAHWPAVTASRYRLAEALSLRAAPGDDMAAASTLAAALETVRTLGLEVEVAAERGAVAECVRDGRKWRITLGHRCVLVAHSVGVLHLAMLLANPRQEVRALDLVSGVAVLSRSHTASSQPVLDQVAVREYRRRLQEIQKDIDNAGPDADPEKLAAVRAEQEWLLTELAAATGINGRKRSFTDDGERARIAVGKAIRRAIQRIGEADPQIGQHLRRTVHTGNQCCYWPT